MLDHFDAVKIGLTATPALHTTEIFGPPVYTYSYREAVIDGFLVDHEPPIRIVTALAEDGMTRRLEPLDRIRELGDASVPFEFDVHALIRSDDAPTLEKALHKRFIRNQVNKVNARKEFFRVPLSDVRAHVEQMGIGASWTLTAEARQHRETLAIERAMAAKTFDEHGWAEQQLREASVAEETDAPGEVAEAAQ